jgi:response regulator NasT
VAEAGSGQKLVDDVLRHRPNLVVTDICMDEMDGLSAIAAYSRSHQTVNIVVSVSNDFATFERASACPVQAYLHKPISEANLAAAISIATTRFAEFQALQHDFDRARRRLSEHGLIEKAKGILMKRAAVDETTAYEKMRALARSSRLTIGQIANNLLLAEDAIAALKEQQQCSDVAT